MESLPPDTVSHLEAASLKGAGDWAVTIPWTSGLQLHSSGFKVAVARRLRLALPNFKAHLHGTRCPKVAFCAKDRTRKPCPGFLDDHGHHAFRCKLGGASQWRHDSVATALIAVSKAAGVAARPAGVGDVDLSAVPPSASGKTKAVYPDVVLGPFEMPTGEFVNVDVSSVCAEPVAKPEPCVKRMQQRVKSKHRKYHAVSAALGRPFVAAVFNTLGGMHPDFLYLLKRLGKNFEDGGNSLNAFGGLRFAAFWRHHISICVQRLAADSICRHIHSAGELHTNIRRGRSPDLWAEYEASGAR